MDSFRVDLLADDLDVVVVLFELPLLDGVPVHEPLCLFEGDTLLVVGRGRIVGEGEQSAHAFHDAFGFQRIFPFR